LKSEIVEDTQATNNFIQDNLVRKFSLLKQAQDIISTITDPKSDKGQIELYRHELADKLSLYLSFSLLL
jgi:hypothetical protein